MNLHFVLNWHTRLFVYFIFLKLKRKIFEFLEGTVNSFILLFFYFLFFIYWVIFSR